MCRNKILQHGISSFCSIDTEVDSVNEILNAIDILVVPSIYEGTPNIVLESMMCGTPVLISQEANSEKLIESGKNGYEFSIKDESSFLNAIECTEGILLSPSLGNVDLLLEKYNENYVVNNFINLIEKVV